MHTESATAVQSFGIEVRARRDVVTVSFKSRSGRRVSAQLALQGETTGALLAQVDDFLAAEGIEVGGDWSFISGGGFRAMGFYA